MYKYINDNESCIIVTDPRDSGKFLELPRCIYATQRYTLITTTISDSRAAVRTTELLPPPGGGLIQDFGNSWAFLNLTDRGLHAVFISQLQISK